MVGMLQTLQTSVSICLWCLCVIAVLDFAIPLDNYNYVICRVQWKILAYCRSSQTSVSFVWDAVNGRRVELSSTLPAPQTVSHRVRDHRATLGLGGGGKPLVTQYWGGTRHFFLLILYNFKNIGGGGHAPWHPLLHSPWDCHRCWNKVFP